MSDDTTAIAKPASLARWLTETRDMLDRLGVQENAVLCLPAIAALFGATGLPAAGLAITSIFGSGIYGVWKMHTYQQTIRQVLHGAVGEVEVDVEDVRQAVDDLRETVEDVRAEAKDMASKLLPEQVEQLGTIFEQFMASLDEDWLHHLRNAVRGVVAGNLPSDTRKAVLAHLRSMGPSHVTGLNALFDEGGESKFIMAREEGNREARELFSQEVESVLLAAGFIERKTGGASYSSANQPLFRITALGKAASNLLSE